MHIRKAIITAAGRGVRIYPAADPVQKAMLPLIDRDGVAKPVLQIIAEEALAGGVEEICLVCAPGDEEQYLRQFRALRENLLAAYPGVAWAQTQAARVEDLLRRLHFVVQAEPLGYGHAVYCARDFTRDNPFLLLLGDHLYLSHTPAQRCAEQIIALATRQECAVAAVQATRESQIGNYGALSGLYLSSLPGVYQIERIIEKPSVTQAEMELLTAGLRAGFYFCFFGMHVLTPAIFDLLNDALSAGNDEVQLTPALQELARREKYLALEINGSRHDIGQKYGLLQAQIALSLAGPERDQVLTSMVELLAEGR